MTQEIDFSDDDGEISKGDQLRFKPTKDTLYNVHNLSIAQNLADADGWVYGTAVYDPDSDGDVKVKAVDEHGAQFRFYVDADAAEKL